MIPPRAKQRGTKLRISRNSHKKSEVQTQRTYHIIMGSTSCKQQSNGLSGYHACLNWGLEQQDAHHTGASVDSPQLTVQQTKANQMRTKTIYSGMSRATITCILTETQNQAEEWESLHWEKGRLQLCPS